MRGSIVILALVALTATSVAPTAMPRTTSLRVTFWEDGTVASAPTATWTLRCNPAGGTLVRPMRACGRLVAGGAALFKGVPPSTACTAIYGGPQRARIVGTVAGKRVWAVLGRSNGCEISRWNALSPWLLPAGGVTG